MTIIFAATIGRSGLGGQAWAAMQYLLGLRALGHDVYYLEDCGAESWVYHWYKRGYRKFASPRLLHVIARARLNAIWRHKFTAAAV